METNVYWSRADPHTWFTSGSKVSAAAMMIKASTPGLFGTEPQHQQTLHRSLSADRSSNDSLWLINVASNLSTNGSLPGYYLNLTDSRVGSEQDWLDWEAACVSG